MDAAPYSFTTRCPDDYLSGVVDPDETLPEGVEHISDALGRLISDLPQRYRAEGAQVVCTYDGRRASPEVAKVTILSPLIAQALSTRSDTCLDLDLRHIGEVIRAIREASRFDPTPPPAANALAAPVERAA